MESKARARCAAIHGEIQVSDITDEQVEAAARALAFHQWPHASEKERASWSKRIWHEWQAKARAALTAAAQAGKDEWRLKVLEFANAILHGDDEHRAWLVEAADYFVKGGKVPRPRSQAPITPDQPNIRALLSDCHRYLNCGPNDTKAVLELSARIEAVLAAPETLGRAEDGWRPNNRATLPDKMRPGWWTHDDHAMEEIGEHLYYFAPSNAASPPYKTQKHVEAVIDIAEDGTLAGVELIEGMPPPPLAARPSPPAQSGEGVMTPEQRAREFIEVGFRSLGVPSLEPYIKIVSELIAGAEADATAAAQAQIATLTQALAEAQEVIAPFGKEVDNWSDSGLNKAYDTWKISDHTRLTVGDLRRARAFLERSKTMGAENER